MKQPCQRAFCKALQASPHSVRDQNVAGTRVSWTSMRHWDPDCWLDGEIYYAISGGQDPHLMKSTDLREWEYIGRLLHDQIPPLDVPRDEDISCPNMFRIGDKWMLLCLSHWIGSRYYLGDFRNEQFLPDSHGRMNWMCDFKGGDEDADVFAPESSLTPDGRRVMWAWARVKHRLKVWVPTGLLCWEWKLETTPTTCTPDNPSLSCVSARRLFSPPLTTECSRSCWHPLSFDNKGRYALQATSSPKQIKRWLFALYAGRSMAGRSMAGRSMAGRSMAGRSMAGRALRW